MAASLHVDFWNSVILTVDWLQRSQLEYFTHLAWKCLFIQKYGLEQIGRYINRTRAKAHPCVERCHITYRSPKSVHTCNLCMWRVRYISVKTIPLKPMETKKPGNYLPLRHVDPLLQLTLLTTPFGIRIHSAVLPQYTFQTDRQTDREMV